MPELRIQITEKAASAVGNPHIVCGNSDYTVSFTFDSEWDACTAKTARFSYLRGGQRVCADVLFEGDSVSVPVLRNTDEVEIGVYAGNLHTSTPARIPCARCITDGSPVHTPPAPDVYNQLMEYLAGLQRGRAQAGNTRSIARGCAAHAVGAAAPVFPDFPETLTLQQGAWAGAIGTEMGFISRNDRCTVASPCRIPAGKMLTISCAASGIMGGGVFINSAWIIGSTVNWQAFPLEIDNRSGTSDLFYAPNFKKSSGADITPSDAGTVTAEIT